MTLLPAEAKKMLFTLRYPPDKILDILEGTFAANASSSPPFASRRTNETISHDFGTTVFTQLTFSVDGGTTWQDQNVAVPDVSDPMNLVFDTYTVGAYSTTTDIVIVAANYTSTNKSVTYKVVLFSKD